MSVPVVIGISIIVFSMMHLTPGDPAQAMLGPLATQETLQKVRHDLGLDQPLYVQYGRWLSRAVVGDLGDSIRLNRPVLPEVLSKFGASLILASVAFVIAVSAGLTLGMISAVRRGSFVDGLVTTISTIGISTPPFYLGMLLIIVFSVYLGVLPASGMYDVRRDPSLGELLQHLILPALALAAAPMTVVARMTRSSMLEILNQDFVRTARAKGLGQRTVLVRHALRNALVPVITVLGLQVGYLLSATALVEIVFSWPGLGSLLVQSVVQRDLPLAQGAVIVIALVYVVVNIATDLIQVMLDPRIQLR
jgi:peptide/nickel transport system permease protein